MIKKTWTYKQQKSKAIRSVNDIQAPRLQLAQYYNVNKTVIIMMIKIKSIKTICIEDHYIISSIVI